MCPTVVELPRIQCAWNSSKLHTCTCVPSQAKIYALINHFAECLDMIRLIGSPLHIICNTYAFCIETCSVSVNKSIPGSYVSHACLNLLILEHIYGRADIKFGDFAPNPLLKNRGGIQFGRGPTQPSLQKSPGAKYGQNFIWWFKHRPPSC